MWGDIWDGIVRSFSNGWDDPQVWLALVGLFLLLALVGKIEKRRTSANRDRHNIGA